MAKRKRLNIRVAVLLGAIGLVLVALVLAWAIGGLGGRGIMDRLFPKDYQGLYKKAQIALDAEHPKNRSKRKDYEAASKALRDAIDAARAVDFPDIQEYYYLFARMNYEWFLDANVMLTRTQRHERGRNAVASLRRALNRDPAYIEAQRYLAKIFWDVAVGSRGRPEAWTDYVREADKLLELVPDDHEVYYQRGRAKAGLAQGMEGQMAKEAIKDFEAAIAKVGEVIAGKAKALESAKDDEGLAKELKDFKDSRERYWLLGLIRFVSQLESRQEQVEEMYVRAVEDMPDSAAILISYAGRLRRQRKNDEAKKRIDEAIEKDAVQGTIALATHYMALGKTDEALVTLERVEQLDRLEPQAYAGQADIYSRRKEDAKAAAALRRGLSAIEGSVGTQPAARQRRLAASRVQLYYLLADVLLDMVQENHKEKDKLLEEARHALGRMTAMNVSPPARAKIAGRIAFVEGKIGEAVRELEASYNASPLVDVRTANLLINIYLRQNLPGKAEAILDRLLGNPRQQRNVSVLMAKVKLLMRYRDFDKADQIVNRVLKLDPQNVEAINTKMVILAVQGNEPLPKSDIPLSASTLRMLLDRASALWVDGRQTEAVRYAEHLYKRAPKDKTVIRRLFSMYRALNRLEDAEKLLDEAIKDYPDDKSLVARRTLVRETDWRKQREVLMKTADEYPPLRRELEKANIAIMFSREMGEQAELEHVRHLQEALRIDPNAPGVVDRLFRYGLNRRDWKVAEDCVDRAVKGNLDGGKGMFFKARLAMVREQFDGVIEAAEAVLEARPDRKDARVLLGEAYLRKHIYDKAYENFKIVAENDPGYAPALIGLAAVTQVQGNSTEHRAYVVAAHRLVPQEPYIRERYLEIERETASPEELITQRERTLKQQPDDLRNILGLAFLYERVGRLKDAENMFVTFHQKSLDKLNSARVLCGFYVRMGRGTDVERTIEPLLQTWKDKVGVLILYGDVMTRLDPERAKGFFEQAVTANVDDPRGYLYLARYWAALRQWSNAVDALDKYVHRRPHDVAGIRELIGYYIEAGDYGPAEKRVDELLRSDPTDAGAMTLKGVLALRQGRAKEAMDLFTQAIEDSPQSPYPLIHRARLYMAKGEPSKARADLRAAKRLSQQVEVAMQLGQVYEALRDYDNAELIYREVRAERKNHMPAIDRLIIIYSRRRKWQELEKLLAEAQELFPNRAGYHVAEAAMWHERDNVPKKLAALEKAVQIAPDALVPIRAYLIALQEAKQHEKVLAVSQPYAAKTGFSQLVTGIRACSMAKLDRRPEADKLFLDALETIHVDYALSLVGQLRDAYGPSESVEKLKKWAAERPQSWRVFLILGVLQSESDKLQESLEALKTARQLAGKNELAVALADRQLGASYYRMEKFTEAEAAYVAALKTRPNDPQVLNNLAYLYTNDLNQPKKALPYAAEATRFMPNNAKVLDTYGWTLARIGRMADAEMALVRAVQLEKPLAASRYHLGWVYEQLGRLDEALKQYRQAYEMVRSDTDDPLHGPANEALERVRRRLQEITGSEK
ncbi:MAG: tetratricopeptide repeat protein [Phycisphaerae bacterium]